MFLKLLSKRAVWLTLLAFLVLLLAPPAATSAPVTQRPQTQPPVVLTLFWGDSCSHCHEEMTDLEVYKKNNPNLEIRTFELWHHPENVPLLEKVSKQLAFEPSAVPVTFLGGKFWVGYASTTATEIKQQLDICLRDGCQDEIATILSPEEIKTAVSFTSLAEIESSQTSFLNSPLRWVVIGIALIALVLFFYFGLRTPPSAKKNKKPVAAKTKK